MTNASVLVIAPHALDEVLGCGGTIALEASAGRKIDILVLFGDGTGLDGQRRPETLQLTEIARLVELFASANRPAVL